MALFSSDNYKSPQVGAANGAEVDKDPLSRIDSQMSTGSDRKQIPNRQCTEAPQQNRVRMPQLTRNPTCVKKNEHHIMSREQHELAKQKSEQVDQAVFMRASNGTSLR